jgi:hypothetical protein
VALEVAFRPSADEQATTGPEPAVLGLQVLLDFKQNIQFKDRKPAAASLANVKTHFPTAAHRCHNLAVEKANEYGL